MENCPTNDMMISSNEICTYIGVKLFHAHLVKRQLKQPPKTHCFKIIKNSAGGTNGCMITSKAKINVFLIFFLYTAGPLGNTQYEKFPNITFNF